LNNKYLLSRHDKENPQGKILSFRREARREEGGKLKMLVEKRSTELYGREKGGGNVTFAKFLRDDLRASSLGENIWIPSPEIPLERKRKGIRAFRQMKKMVMKQH